MLQQCLPFTVLKLFTEKEKEYGNIIDFVATVLTVYGIETQLHWHQLHRECSVATVLTVYGIETKNSKYRIRRID